MTSNATSSNVTRRKRSSIAQDVLDEARRLSNGALTATAIRRQLIKEFGESEVPSPRTIQEIVREEDTLGGTTPWKLGAADDADVASLILPAVAAVAEATEGHRPYVTCGEAEWIVQVTRAAPTIPPYSRFMLAREYLRRASQEADTSDLDLLLALDPWNDDANRLLDLVERRWAPDSLVATLLRVSGLVGHWDQRGADGEFPETLRFDDIALEHRHPVTQRDANIDRLRAAITPRFRNLIASGRPEIWPRKYTIADGEDGGVVVRIGGDDRDADELLIRDRGR